MVNLPRDKITKAIYGHQEKSNLQIDVTVQLLSLIEHTSRNDFIVVDCKLFNLDPYPFNQKFLTISFETLPDLVVPDNVKIMINPYKSFNRRDIIQKIELFTDNSEEPIDETSSLTIFLNSHKNPFVFSFTTLNIIGYKLIIYFNNREPFIVLSDEEFIIKDFLSICSIIKNQKDLEEWIIYHNYIGVDHFYIYDNQSDISIKQRLSNSFFNPISTVIDFPGQCVQMDAYHNYLHYYGFYTEWALIIDDDEFMTLNGNLKDFLDARNSLQAISVHWVLYGTNYHNEHQKFVIESYTRRAARQEKTIKSFSKPEYTINFPDPHFVLVENPKLYQDAKGNEVIAWSTIITVDVICIYHFYVKSYQDWMNKRIRGDAFYDNQTRLQTDSAIIHSKDNDVVDTNLKDRYFLIIKEIYDRVVDRTE